MIRVGSSCLPAELADRIIDFCHDHKRTLLSCALTHSSWLPTSRLHLFHTITSSGETRTTRAVELKSIINNTPISVSRRWPSILTYIKIVKIASSRSDRLANATYLAHAIRGFCSSRRLPSPSVHVSLSRFKSSQGVLLSLLNDTITHVELLNVTFTPGNDVWPFLSSLSRLQHLALSATEANEPSGYDLPTGTAFEGIPLSTLRMTTASMGFVVSSIIKIAGSLPQLEDFGIFYEDIRQEGLPQLADAIQRTVKCLRFSASCYPGDWRDTESRPSGSDIRIPDFVGRFRSLRTLVLDNLIVDGSGGYDRSDISFQWIAKVLQQLSSPIRKLVFEVTATSYVQLKRIPWASIDRIVSAKTPQFRELVSVEVCVKRGVRWGGSPSSIGKDVVIAEVVRRLPALSLLGILRCDTTLTV